ncbi:MAG: Hsp20/alpha crystallin family protein [Deltaproteobacteria bacterium]|nr:MAG: Hsp20/alpha crystallin family protein [Deltaproteobacteria bacterium]
MALVRWDPFKDLVSFKERMDRLFEDTLSRSRGIDESLAPGIWSPPVDIYETGDNIIMKAELPGISKNDINLEVKDNTLTLKGERKFEKEVKEENYHRIERSYGTFQRSFALPTNIERDKVEAKFQDGILEVTLPKVEEAKPKQIKVEVK